MAKKKYDSSEGVWRTIGGRRVFIKTGQSLSDAMKESGKFKTKMNEEAVKGAREEDLKEQYKDSLNNVSKMEYNGEITKEEYDKAVKDINKAYIDKRNEYAGIKKGNIKTITQEEYDKLPKDYKGTLKELVETAEFRGENKEELRKFYEKQGFNIEEDKTILENENGGTILRPVKVNKSDDKFYTRKDGTKEYDPYKGTRFEKKYDSVEDALNDPNHPTRKYIDEKLKVPRASGAKDFSEYGIRIEDNDTKARFSDYLRDKYGTDDFRIISYDDSKKAQNIYSEFNKQELKAYQDKMLNNDEYLAKTNPGMYLNKIEKEAGVRTFADDIALMDRYKGTYEHLQKTTNMSGASQSWS